MILVRQLNHAVTSCELQFWSPRHRREHELLVKVARSLSCNSMNHICKSPKKCHLATLKHTFAEGVTVVWHTRLIRFFCFTASNWGDQCLGLWRLESMHRFAAMNKCWLHVSECFKCHKHHCFACALACIFYFAEIIVRIYLSTESEHFQLPEKVYPRSCCYRCCGK